MAINELIKSPVVGWMAADGPESDIVITSRVRLARNLANMPFPHLLSKKENMEEIWKMVEKAAKDLPNLQSVPMSGLLNMERQILLEKHLISPDHAEAASPFRDYN